MEWVGDQDCSEEVVDDVVCRTVPAGQLMAESSLDNRAKDTVSGGQGIAGLDQDHWKTWKP